MVDKTEIVLTARDETRAAFASATNNLSQLSSHATALAGSFRMLGATVAVGLFATMVKGVADSGDALQKLSLRTGETVENLSKLGYAASLADVNSADLQSGLTRLNRTMGEAADGSKEARDALARFGILPNNGKSLMENFQQIAERVKNTADASTVASAANDVFGRSFANLLPVLKEGREGLGKASDELERMGGVLSTDLANASAEFNDNLTRLQTIASALKNEVLGPVVALFADWSGEMVKASTNSDKLSGSGVLLKSVFQTVFETVAVLGVNVVYVFKQIGNEIGGVAAQLGALARLDFDAFSSIGKMMGDDAKAARIEVDALSYRLLNLAKINDNYKDSWLPRKESAGEGISKALVKAPKPKNMGGEAQAQLALDLEIIKSYWEQTTNAYANNEKIMEAMRAASLVDDKEYYASKLGFIKLGAQAQESALQAEIDRLQRETLSGKDKLANDKKIADAQAKLMKVRSDASTAIVVNSIQEEAAIKSLAQAYANATIAAEDYMTTVLKQNAREVAGVGRGDKSNSRNARLAELEDKFTGEKAALLRDKRNEKITQEYYEKYLSIITDTYEKEVAAFNAKNTAIDSAQLDWTNGATRALENYRDASLDIAGQTANAFTSAFKDIEDALVKFVTTGKLDLKSLADSIIATFARIQIQQLMGSMMGGKGGGTGGDFMGMIAKWFSGFAMGGVVTSPSLSAYSGQIVNQPTPFRFAAGAGIMGEAGPEAIIPLKRGSDGRLGVSGGAGPTNHITINVNSSTGDPAEIRRSAAAGARSALNALSGAKRYG